MAGACRQIEACRLCGGKTLVAFLDFGAVPLGNDLRSTAAEARAAPSYPLALERCGDCGHFQLACAVDPTVLYATNYTYLSGIGPSFVRHFADYAEWIAAHLDLPKNPVVADIGSNDGTCLKAFKARGFTVCGVDPASLAARIANESGIETINTFFDATAVAEIKRRHGPVDFVTSHNVLAHVDDLSAVFRNIHDLLGDRGYLCFEIGYFREVLKNGHFDTIYHEHLDYHHAAPLVRHLVRLGFDVLELGVNAVQGGSLRLLARKSAAPRPSDQVRAFLAAERQSVLYDESFLSSWRQRIEAAMAEFGARVKEQARRGRAIAGYGAPTKATLLMKIAGIGAGEVAYVAEDNPHKTGLFFPGTAIPIRPTAELLARPPDVLVLFAWNFADDIIAKLRGKLEGSVEIIVPLPELRSITL